MEFCCSYLAFLQQTVMKVPFDLLQIYHKIQLSPGLNANEIQIPYDKHHKVSLLVKIHQNTHSSVIYDII